MVYIYKKVVAGRPYYYLRTSERRGTKVIAKDIAYLGNSIEEVKKALENFPQYKDKIRKGYKTIHNFLESNYYLEKAESLKLKKDEFLGKKLVDVEACKIHYNNVFKKNDESTKKEIFRDFIIDFAFNTTSIEGNTITLQEARNLLIDGLTPKDKTLREIYDLQNTERIFLNLVEPEKEINHDTIINIHSGLMQNIDARIGYRRFDVRVIRANFKSTPAPYVKTDMDLLLKWYEQNKKKLHPLVLASIFHHKFEKIHPFMDGNGRTGRMLLNLVLMRNNYPPLIIHKKTRALYLEELRNSDNSNLTDAKKEHYAGLIQFTADELSSSYWGIFL